MFVLLLFYIPKHMYSWVVLQCHAMVFEIPVSHFREGESTSIRRLAQPTVGNYPKRFRLDD